SLSWGDWYLSMPRLLAANHPAGARDLLSRLDGLSKHMQQASPHPRDSGELAAKAALQFKSWLDEPWAHHGPQLVKRMKTLLLDHGSQAFSWDRAEQSYLALVALNQVHPDPAATRILNEMGRMLAFPRDHELIDNPIELPANSERFTRLI